ncbi:hypothetical protein [Laceyella tengchongensis]
MSKDKSGNSFEFHGGFENNNGQINIGSEVHNYQSNNLSPLQTKLLKQLDHFLLQLNQNEEIEETVKQLWNSQITELRQEVAELTYQKNRLQQWKEKLESHQPFFSTWQTLTSTISMICDLIQQLNKV